MLAREKNLKSKYSISHWVPKNYYKTFIIFLVFVGLLITLNIFCRYIDKTIIDFDCPKYWPISIFRLYIPHVKNLLAGIIALILFYLSNKYLRKIKYQIITVIFVGIIFVLSTNLIKGWANGFIMPIAGGLSRDKYSFIPLDEKKGGQYFHDAKKIRNLADLFKNYERLQPGLSIHTKTHPPGAVFIIYLISKIYNYPGFITLVIAVTSIFLSTFFLFQILKINFSSELSGYLAFLFTLIPSIQIYYAASLDALIASFLLGVLYFFLHHKTSVSYIGSLIFLLLASMTTFVFLFILPVMIGYDLLKRKSLKRSGFIILGLGIIYLIIYLLLNFNYLNSFLIASKLENPHGFRLFYEPVNYLFTRIECICEIILFFGPYLSILMVQGIVVMKRKRLNSMTSLTWLAIFTLITIFATGAFHTAETARVCLFIYPYLIFPIGFFLKYTKVSPKEKNTLLYLIFLQTIIMQIGGNYFW